MENSDGYRLTDRDLLILISQGNAEARALLDERYTFYCRNITKSYLETHCNYGLSYDDFFNAAILGYCRARIKFDFENSDGFYPYFRVWAMSEMNKLTEENETFYLHDAPEKFVSLDLTYNKDGESMVLAESIGSDDNNLLNSIRYEEIITCLTDSSLGLTELESVICSCLVLKYSEKEIRDYFCLSYRRFRVVMDSIKFKLDSKFHELIK